MKAPKLNKRQKNNFEFLTNAPNIALVSGFYNEQPRALLCSVTQVGEEFQVTPLAMLLEGADLSLLKDADGVALP